MESITIAIDAMGGDHGPDVIIPASIKSLERHQNLHLILVGDEKALTRSLATYNIDNHPRIKTVFTSEIVGMDESPSAALRSKKDSSMRVAINQVKESTAQACVSAGNTGALMAIARFVLKTQPGIDRPAIIARLPTRKKDKEVRMLDLGANVDSSAENLFQFAIMGSVLTSACENISSPKVALLNIGEEEIKGNEVVKEASEMLHKYPKINYIGYVEGDAIFSGDVDVVVCDGFVGNVALKTLEGAANLFTDHIKKAFTSSWLIKLGAFLASPARQYLRQSLDPRRRNGASLAGLQGIVIKSHGGADKIAFHCAIEEAVLEIEKNVAEKTKEQIAHLLQETSKL